MVTKLYLYKCLACGITLAYKAEDPVTCGSCAKNEELHYIKTKTLD